MSELTSVSRERELYRVTIICSFINLLLLILKFLAGMLGHSAAMLADAVHSLSDFVTDLIVLIFVRISNKPQDQGHDNGHGKYETLATAIIGLVLLGVGVGIFWNGASTIYLFFNGVKIEQPGLIALVAALVSIFFKEGLFRYTYLIGKRFDSSSVIANAWHHRSDAFSSIGTALGIGGAVLLGDEWAVLDPLAAVVVSFFIVKVSLQLVVPCIEELLEKSLPQEVEADIEAILLSFPEVSEPHHLRTRQIGSYCAIEVHIRMAGEMALTEAHEVTTAIEKRLKETFGQRTLITIHVEPKK
ncbi:MAG: cation transporter [Bacteroidia bacterium]|jgi:cation diffusion facilitator family transporter|nr:cation transporter [Bacteroidia bacterium]